MTFCNIIARINTKLLWLSFLFNTLHRTFLPENGKTKLIVWCTNWTQYEPNWNHELVQNYHFSTEVDICLAVYTYIEWKWNLCVVDFTALHICNNINTEFAKYRRYVLSGKPFIVHSIESTTSGLRNLNYYQNGECTII